MSIFDDDLLEKPITDEFLLEFGFSHPYYSKKGYFSKVYYTASYSSGILAYYSRPNNNLYIQKYDWSKRSKKYKVYNQTEFLTALYKHKLIYRDESNSI